MVTQAPTLVASVSFVSTFLRGKVGRRFSSLIAGLIGLCAASSALALPSVKIGAAAPVSPSDADLYYPSTTTHTNGLGLSGRPAEIVELARSLGNDPDKIYDFVRNNVDTVWMYGEQKGALGALIDRSGTAFDQAALMVELLRQAGFTANYRAGSITPTAAQFQGWTGTTNAQAACQLLASGGIPAIVNGSTPTSCSTLTGSLTSIEFRHVWVSVNIGGTNYVFDPSLKDHQYTGLHSCAVLSGSTPLTTAGGTQGTTVTDNGTTTTADDKNWNTTLGLNATALNSELMASATAMLSCLNQTANQGVLTGTVDDLIGGARIVRVNAQGQDITLDSSTRVTSLSYAPAGTSWTEIPNQYRTTLTVSGVVGDVTVKNLFNAGSAITFYVDEIYGRKLIVDSNFDREGTQDSSSTLVVTLRLQDETGASLKSWATTAGEIRDFDGSITLAVDHPYAAVAPDETASGTYMDASMSRPVKYALPFVIVHAWGDAGHGLVDKWGARDDKNSPHIDMPPCETCTIHQFVGTVGDGRREQLAASWIVQSSRAARLNASIANSAYALHHSMGVVAGDVYVEQVVESEYDLPPYDLRISDNFDRIDVESALSLTNRAADSTKRRAALHTIAAMIDALEGSVAAQVADLADTVSTATRFEWGNNPVSQDGSTVGPRAFFQLSDTSYTFANIKDLLMVEGVEDVVPCNTQTMQGMCGVSSNTNQVYMGDVEYAGWEGSVADIINSYNQAGFTVVSSREAFLGPGQRAGTPEELNRWHEGYFDTPGDLQTHTWVHMPAKQRGGAVVANKYDANGDPVEIAHIAVGYDVAAKGGGGGAQATHEDTFDPAVAADVLKSHFVDKSNALGVDLQAGKLTYSSPAALSVGNGEFPYSLSASLIWRGGQGTRENKYATSHIQPQAPWTTNWNNALTLSGSGLEAMGASDVRAAIGTVVAFMTAQKIFESTPTQYPTRDVAGVLVAAWWAKQLAANVATVAVGSNTRQFVKIYDGSWIATGAGPYATLTQTGDRVLFDGDCPSGYALTRGWDISPMSFTVTNAQGDTQSFPSFVNHIGGDGCTRVAGFRLSSWVFPYGVTVTLGYSPNYLGVDTLAYVSNNLGRRINFVNGGLADSQHDGGFNNNLTGNDLREVTFEKTAADGLSNTHTDPSGKKTTFIYEKAPWYDHGVLELKKVYTADHPYSTEPELPNVQYTYDSLRRVKEVSDAVALQWGGRNPYQFFIADGVRGERVDPAGGRYAVVFDDQQKPFRYYNELGYFTKVEHDGRGRATKYTYPELDQEILSYDLRNNPIKLIKKAKPGSSLADIVVEASWNSTWNKPDWVKDGLTRQTDFHYWGTGEAGTSMIKDVMRPLARTGDTTRATYQYWYNTKGQLNKSVDPTGLTATKSYNATSGNLESATVDPTDGDPDTDLNIVTQFGYDGIGNQTSITDPRGNLTKLFYDNNRRKTYTLHLDSASAFKAGERSEYDDVGRVTHEYAATAVSDWTNPGAGTWVQTKATTYTPTGKAESETDADGSITSYLYDAVDRVRDAIDPELRRTRYEYDLAGQQTKETRGYGSPVQAVYATRTYTHNGKEETVKDARNNVTAYVYDGFDRLDQLTYPDGTYERNCEYDAQGNVKLRLTRSQASCGSTDAASQIAFTFDGLDRKWTKTLPVTGGTSVTTWNYDLAGRLDQVSDPSFTIQNDSRDTAKRLLSTKHTLPGLSQTLSVTYGYDLAGNRTKVTWPDGYQVDYTFDALNRMDTVTEHGSTLLADYDYDTRSRRTSLTYGNNVVVRIPTTGGYSLAGDLTRLEHDFAGTTNDLAFDYTYTAAHQLKSLAANLSSYVLAAPAVATESYGTANNVNQYPTVGANSVGYDIRGNLTGYNGWTYGYDLENRMLTASNSTTSAAYQYDPFGHRAKRTVGTSPGVVTYFLGDEQDDEIAEYGVSSGSPQLQYRYVPGPGIDEPIAQVAANGTRKYFHEDRIGSVIAMSDSTGATVEGPYTYDAYGRGGAVTGVPYKYTGRRLDAETGLYYYRARYYSADLGRFLQTDPIGTKDDINLYAYVKNDPLDGTDALGEQCESGPSCSGQRDEKAFLDGSISKDNLAANNEARAAGGAAGAAVVATATAATIASGGVGASGLVLARSTGLAGKMGTHGGSRAGKPFTRAGHREVKARNAEQHGGKTTCEACGKQTTPATQSQKGVRQSGDETRVDHVYPQSKGGNGDPSNGQVLCNNCNNIKSDSLPNELPPGFYQ